MQQDIKEENQKKKAYLMSYQIYKNRAKRLEEQLTEIRLNEMAPSVKMSDMPSSHNQKDLSDYIVKYDRTISNLLRVRYKAITLFTEIQVQIELLEDEMEKDILTQRYLRGYRWEQIAVNLNISSRHAYRIHGQALRNFQIKKYV